MDIHRVSDYRSVEQTLRIPDLKQSLYDEGGILMDNVLVTLHGDEHRKRRSIEGQLFRRDFFRAYESDVFPRLLKETLDQFLLDDHIDLKSLGYRILVHQSLQFAGIDRIDGSIEEADAQHRLLTQLGQAATVGQFRGDRAPIMAEIAAAIVEFRDRFFMPSRARREALIEQFRRGEIDEQALPRDILTILLLHADDLAMPDELLVREVAFFYLASSHTSVHTLVHAANEVFLWCDRNQQTPAEIAADPWLMQRFVHESLRLHPSSPEAWRKAEAPLELPDGRTVAQGDKVVIDLQAANRDTKVFGDDAAQFNPFRERTIRLSAAGMSFGGGMHICLGMNLVAGTMLRPGDEPKPDNHQYGTIALVLIELFGRGMTRDPEQQAEKIVDSERDVWKVYPVCFGAGRA